MKNAKRATKAAGPQITLKGVTIAGGGMTISNANLSFPAAPLITQLRAHMGTAAPAATGATRGRPKKTAAKSKGAGAPA
jgi:hypothetical protein